MTLQFPFLFFCEPIAGAGEQFSFQLRIDLIVHDTFTINQMFYFNTDESPTAGGIGERVKTVACADERSDARQVAEFFW